MKSIYISRNTLRIAITKVLKTIIPGAIYFRFSHFFVNEIPKPTLSYDEEVLVKIIMCGICGTDLDLVNINVDLKVAPAALSTYSKIHLGHEVLAEVAAMGKNVIGLEIGDRIIINGHKRCEILDIAPCKPCSEDKPYICQNTHLQIDKFDKPIDIWGGWSEFWTYHYKQIVKVPQTLSNKQAVLIEPLSIAIHAVFKTKPKPGDKILVIGAGFIGLSAIITLEHFFSEVEIYCIAKHQFQKDLASKYGAKLVKDTSYKNIATITSGTYHKGLFGNEMIIGGFDSVFDCVGNSKTLKDSLRWTRGGGTTVLVGVKLFPAKFDPSPIWYQEVNLIGTVGSGYDFVNGMKKHSHELAFEILDAGKVDANDFVSHEFGLNDYKKALKVATNKNKFKSVKVVFNHSLNQF